MGAVRSKISRLASNTVMTETRMHREVSKEKPRQAPRHPSTEEAFKNLVSDNPVLQDIDKVKDTEYLKLLSDLKVDSVDEKISCNLASSLPSKSTGTRPVPGRISSEQVLEMLSLRKLNSEEWTTEKITKKYHLTHDVVDNILCNFSSFNVLKIKKEESAFKRIDII